MGWEILHSGRRVYASLSLFQEAPYVFNAVCVFTVCL